MGSRTVRDRLDGRLISVRMPSTSPDAIHLVGKTHLYDPAVYEAQRQARENERVTVKGIRSAVVSTRSEYNVQVETHLQTLWKRAIRMLTTPNRPNRNVNSGLIPLALTPNLKARLGTWRMPKVTNYLVHKVNVKRLCPCHECEAYRSN